MQELWLPIPGCNGFYEASNLGRVRSTTRTVTRPNGVVVGKAGRILKPQYTARRYSSVSIAINGVTQTRVVHRLIATTFIPNPSCYPEVNHIDGNRDNNAANNLEWVTRLENNSHAILTGLMRPARGCKHGNAVLTEDQVLKLRELRASGVRGVVVAKMFNITPSNVSYIYKRKGWSHI